MLTAVVCRPPPLGLIAGLVVGFSWLTRLAVGHPLRFPTVTSGSFLPNHYDPPPVLTCSNQTISISPIRISQLPFLSAIRDAP